MREERRTAGTRLSHTEGSTASPQGRQAVPGTLFQAARRRGLLVWRAVRTAPAEYGSGLHWVFGACRRWAHGLFLLREQGRQHHRHGDNLLCELPCLCGQGRQGKPGGCPCPARTDAARAWPRAVRLRQTHRAPRGSLCRYPAGPGRRPHLRAVRTGPPWTGAAPETVPVLSSRRRPGRSPRTA